LTRRSNERRILFCLHLNTRSSGVPAVPKATQVTLSHQNRPGMLAHIAKVLGDAKVNIFAYLTTTSGSEGLTHLIVDNADGAKGRLRALGLATPR
jgi:hypothetical protein